MMGSISKRLLTMIPMILGITAVSFVLMQLAPGDPLAMMVDPSIHESDLAQVRENLGRSLEIFLPIDSFTARSKTLIHWRSIRCLCHRVIANALEVHSERI